jgi:drug/metabolite transporter (DMT)-like permease
LFYRFGLAGLLLAALSVHSLRQITRREVEQGMALTLFGTLGIGFQMDGLAYTSASTSAFLTQGYCVLLPLWATFARRRLPSFKTLLCVLLVVSGVTILAHLDWHALRLGRGETETLLASLFFTGQILALENPRYSANRTENFSVVMLLGSALFCLPTVLAFRPSLSACWQAYATLPAFGFLLLLTLFSTFAAFLLMNRWQRHVTATEAGLIYCTEPVVASTLALFLPALFSRWAGVDYPNETLSARLLLGGGLVLAANVLLQSPWLEPSPGVKKTAISVT